MQENINKLEKNIFKNNCEILDLQTEIYKLTKKLKVMEYTTYGLNKNLNLCRLVKRVEDKKILIKKMDSNGI